MNSLSINELHTLRLAIFDNAERLHKEAKLLHENNMFSRAYLLAHFCFEELGKIPIIIGAIGKLMAGEPVDWKKLKKRYQIDNVLIKATSSLQTKLSEISEDEATAILREKSITGREGFFCLVSDRDMDPREVRSMYRSKDIVEKLFSSMKSDIGIRPIRTWTENGVYGVLLVGFLAQAMVSVTRFLVEPASSMATKFITDPMQKLTVTVIGGKDGQKRHVYSNFDRLNTAILGVFGVLEGAEAV